MKTIKYAAATEKDLPFIMETYAENIEALHGAHRTYETWKELLADPSAAYYIVYTEDIPAAWFRVDIENNEMWLGMLQVKPQYHRQGLGRSILSVVEDMAKQSSFQTVGIHTTEDNTAAMALYQSAGYTVTEYGTCTTADGQERMGYTLQKVLET